MQNGKFGCFSTIPQEDGGPMIVKNIHFIQFQSLRENKQVSWHQDGTGDGKSSSDNFFLEIRTFLRIYIQIDMHT